MVDSYFTLHPLTGQSINLAKAYEKLYYLIK